MIHTELNNPYNITAVVGGGGGAVMGPGLADALGPEYNLSFIVSTGDSGGGAGVIRGVLRDIPAVGDVSKVLAAVSSNGAGNLFDRRFGPDVTTDTIRRLNERFLGAIAMPGISDERPAAIMEAVTDLSMELPRLRGQRYGNLVIAALASDHGDITRASEEAGVWLASRGRVIPATAEAHTVYMRDGKKVIEGEAAIDDYTPDDPLKAQVWIENKDGDTPKVTSEAADAAARADRLLVGPGSWFTSLIPVELVDGFSDAVMEQERHGGKLIAVTNLVAEKATMAHMTIRDYLRLLSTPLHREFDFVIYNNNPDDLEALGEVPVRYGDAPMDLAFATAIGANLVSAEQPEEDPSDEIAHLRSKTLHAITPMIDAMRARGVLI